MGTAYFVVLERKIDGLDDMIDGKQLAKNVKVLDAAAEALDVRPLSEFISVDPDTAEEFLDSAGDSDTKLPELQNFPADDGLETVRALMTRPEAEPAMEDLKECERILEVAAEHGVEWHLEVDI